MTEAKWLLEPNLQSDIPPFLMYPVSHADQGNYERGWHTQVNSKALR